MKEQKVIRQALDNLIGDVKVIEKQDISELESLLLKDGLIQILPYDQLKPFEGDLMRLFLNKHGVYVLPTEELIEWLVDEICGVTIEIGCGNGVIARKLEIPATDAMVQDRKDVQLLYALMNQPVIKYPSDIEKLNAEQAIEKYNPNTVIGCFITHRWNGKTGSEYGVIEGRILSRGIKYINVGNDDIHKDKPILKHPHKTYRFDWLITRSDKSKNFIKIWNE